MRPKEEGYVLSIDPASNLAGASLWHNGDLVDVAVLKGDGSDVFARRLQHMVPQLTEFLNANVARPFKIKKVIFEGVRSRLVLITVGAFLTCPRIDCKMHQKFSFVESSSWKKWAQARGATGPFKEIKGVKALLETGWTHHLAPKLTDDIADSIMIYSQWRDLP